MSRKRKQANRSSATEDLRKQTRRHLERGDGKSALKSAQQACRKEKSAEHRELLERAYVARVEQLVARKSFDDARRILSELEDLKPTLAEVREQIPKLKLSAGDFDDDATTLLDDDPSILNELVDRAVRDSRVALPAQGDAREHVSRIRDALAAIESGNDDQAAELLKDVPRTSPASDWKLFVRGLTAFYDYDRERMQANWRRLDPDRTAVSIARKLVALARESWQGDDEPPPAFAPVEGNGSGNPLPVRLQNDPVPALLREIAEHWRSEDWTEFFRSFGKLRQRYYKSHQNLVDQIVDVVWKRAVRDGEENLLTRLQQKAPAPALDPRWNRAKAMLSGNPEFADFDIANECWTAYAEDLKTVAKLSEEERSVAQGLVFRHLARITLDVAEMSEEGDFFYEPDPEEARAFRRDAARHYRESIERCPDLVEAYRGLAELHESEEEPKKAAAVLKRLVKQKPDDFETHVWLANHFQGEDDPAAAAPHVEAAARLKGRDPQIENLRWSQQVATLRRFTIKRKFDDARDAWEELVAMAPEHFPRYSLDVLRAGIEFKEKNLEAAEEHLQSALGRIEEPTAVWMNMSCVAARFRVQREFKKRFDDEFKSAIEKKPTSATAGRLAGFLVGLKVSQVNYTGRATQERLTLKYLKRATNVKWDPEDLERVCTFLRALPRQRWLFNKLSEVGYKKFSDEPYFVMCAAESAMGTSPFSCDFEEAEFLLNRVIELTENATSPRDQHFAESARQQLAILRDFEERMPFGFSRRGQFTEDWDDEDEDEWDDQDSSAGGGFLDSIPPAELIARMREELPPELVKQLEKASRMMGVPLEKMMLDALHLTDDS